MELDFVVAVHGGTSGTKCAAIDLSGTLLSSSDAGPSDPLKIGFQPSARAIYLAISDLCVSIGSSPFKHRWMSISMEGIEHPEDRRLLHKHLAEIFEPDPRLSLHTDLEATFVSAFPSEPGILLMTESRSLAFSIAKGEEIKAGGWGPVLDEEGSTYWIGREALRAAMHSYDGRSSANPLLNTILNWLSIETAEDIASWSVNAKTEEIASIAPLVFGAAKSGDPIALDILKRSAHELAKMVWAVWKKSGLRTPVSVSISGDILKSDRILADALNEELKKMGLETTQKVIRPSALIGAAILAMRFGGVTPTKEIISKIESALYSVYK